MRLDLKLVTSNRVSAALLAVIAACGAPDTGDETSRDMPAADEQSGAQLPQGFPEDFPLLSDFSVTDGQFTEGNAMTQANFLVRGTSAMSVVEIATFYHERLPDAGFTVQGEPPSTEVANALVYFQSDEFQDCSVQLSTTEQGTSILISLPLRD